MLISNRNPWHRRHDDPSQPVVPHPPVRFYPNCRQDLIDIVNLALQNYRPGSQTPLPEIRGNSSHWALSDAAICQGFFVETQNPEINPPDFSPPRLNRALGNVIPTCLTAQANVWKQNQVTAAGPFLPGAPPNQLNDVLFELVHVEAGMRIYELYSSLDIDERSPLALQTMGAAGGQTIVGAFSTGTHGGDVLFPPLADYVVAIHMIAPAFAAPLLRDTPLSERTPYAAEFWIERGDDPDVPPLVDEGLLQAVYPQLPEAAAPITVLRDNDLFDAVRVSAGRMGLIYSVVLRVGWQYCLEQVRTQDTWSKGKTWTNEPANQNFPQPPPSNPLPVDHRFVQVVVNPNAQPLHSGEHTCYVTYHNKKAVGQSPRGRYERRGLRLHNSHPPEVQNAGTTAPIDQPAGLFTLPCSSSSPLKTFVGTLATASLGAAAAAIGGSFDG